MRFNLFSSFAAVLVVAGLVLAACGDDSDPNENQPQQAEPSEFTWDFLPEGYPRPSVPEDNPMSVEKIELGRMLFYDTRLSQNQTQSCASCHRQEFAFTDALPKSIGSEGHETPRGSMSLTNVAYASTLTWVGPLTRSLEDQMLTPLFGDEPIELGLRSQEVLVDRIRADADYVERFEDAFDGADPDGDVVTLDRIVKAISTFQRRLISHRSRYDRYTYYGEEDALSESEKRGEALFFGEKFECFHCHGSFNFSDSVTHEGTVFEETQFHNNGLYNVDGFGAYPDENPGLFEFSGVLEDQGRFRAPTLRNIELTAPYMHDGSIETLEEVLEHYARGGRLIEDGPNAGDGKNSPFKSEFVTGFEATEEEKQDVLNFLKSLTDEEFINDPEFANPHE